MADGGRRRGIRPRITVAAVAVVALALILGAVLFWTVLRGSLYGQLEAAAAQDAAAFAGQADDIGIDALPDLDDDGFWQVVDEDGGGVIAASDVAEDVGALADRDGRVISPVAIPGEGVFVMAAADEGGMIVVAGRSTALADQTLVTVAVLLAVAVPLLTAAVGVTTWIAVGRALAPVERMRQQVATVTAGELSRRLDEPGTGDELDRLARTMNDMLARLDDAQRTQRRFISDASHELRSPLAILRQYAEVARSHPERVSPRDLTDTILSEGGRMERLVEGLLVLARADEHRLALTVVDVDLDDLLWAEATRLRASHAVEVDTAGIGAARVRGDVALLRQVVRNLVDNAVRHAGSRILLSCAVDARGAVLAVADDGPGIPEHERERVFERFVRLDDARSRDAGGSGLGLAIVREIVSGHGGSVGFDAEVRSGARVVVRLPI